MNYLNSNFLDFYVAPMYNHFIELKPGFHAESGCKFHAFIKDYCNDDHPEYHDCHIPWEEYQTVPLGSKSQDYDVINQLKNLNFSKPYLQLKIYPNPFSNYVKIDLEIKNSGYYQ